MNEQSENLKAGGELIQFKIVEKEVIVEVPKYVEKIVEVPKYVKVEYEKPVILEKTYEKPIVRDNDLTDGLRDRVFNQVSKGIAEAIQSLKISMEIPISKVLQVTGRRKG